MGAASLGGALYVCGGHASGTSLVAGPLASVVRLYPFSGGSWTELAPLPTPRQGLGVAALAGCLYACGGWNRDDGGVSARVERFDGTWAAVAPMSTRRSRPGIAAIGDAQLLACGGYDGVYAALASAELYDAEADAWRPVAPMALARSSLGVVGLPHDGSPSGGDAAAPCAIACGGEDAGGEVVGDAELYEPGPDRWRRLSPMPTPRSGLGVAVVRGAVIACGGRDQVKVALSVVERYDIAAGAWSAAVDMPTPRSLFGVATLGDSLYIFGGSASGGRSLAVVERLGPPEKDAV